MKGVRVMPMDGPAGIAALHRPAFLCIDKIKVNLLWL